MAALWEQNTGSASSEPLCLLLFTIKWNINSSSCNETLASLLTLRRMLCNASLLIWDSTWASDGKLCWLVLGQLDTSCSSFRRKHNWDDVPIRLASEQTCDAFPWLMMGGQLTVGRATPGLVVPRAVRKQAEPTMKSNPVSSLQAQPYLSPSDHGQWSESVSQINPFALKLVLVTVFHHSNRSPNCSRLLQVRKRSLFLRSLQNIFTTMLLLFFKQKGLRQNLLSPS